MDSVMAKGIKKEIKKKPNVRMLMLSSCLARMSEKILVCTGIHNKNAYFM